MTTETAAFAGADVDVLERTIDLDTHEMAPTHLWAGMFGPNSGVLSARLEHFYQKLSAENCQYRPELPARDTVDITEANVWETKGPAAPGAYDFDRRLQVMDAMGTRRQLVFPSAALAAFAAMFADAELLKVYELEDDAATWAMLEGVCDEYNRWTVETTRSRGDRYRPVAMLLGKTVDQLCADGRRLIDAGARALWLATSALPGGRSPADHELDRFWSMLEEADVPIVYHIGTEHGFRATEDWQNAPEFENAKLTNTEITFNPFAATTMYMAAATQLTAMTMGGVFERHPRLRMGVIEMGASWFGPLAEHLDLWAASPFKKRMSTILTMPPSAYLARNVRVTPFAFEPVRTYLERWPHLATSYSYNTDYPHVEGGQYAKRSFHEQLAPLGSTVVEQFFAGNGEWIVPD